MCTTANANIFDLLVVNIYIWEYMYKNMLFFHSSLRMEDYFINVYV